MLDLEQPATDSTPAAPAATSEGIGETFDSTDVSTEADLLGEQGQQQAVDDDIEDEIEGVKLRGKKDALERIKAERLMQSDYTRKTQEAAEQRRSFESEKAQFQEAAQSHQQFIREIGQMMVLDEQLAEYEKVNWSQFIEQDPVQALKAQNTWQQLQAQRAQLERNVTHKSQQAQAKQQQETARQILQAREVLGREIKGWGPELQAKLIDYGKAQGFPEQVLSSVTQPAFVKVLHKAQLYDQLLKQRTAKAPAPPAPPVGRVSGGNAANTKKLSEMSDAEYAAARRKYIQNNR